LKDSSGPLVSFEFVYVYKGYDVARFNQDRIAEEISKSLGVEKEKVREAFDSMTRAAIERVRTYG
tara:strand:+ start:325 stop:519 length:195 start_codon:yes stop_codon:yes gene_type:complete